MTALEPVGGPAAYPSRPDPLEMLPQLIQLADRIADTEFVPKTLRKRPEAVLAALMTAADLGLPVMTGLRSISIIEGRPSLSAEVMRALVLSAGHELHVVEMTATRCEVRGRRRGVEQWSPPFVWDLERAEVAGLAAKENWRKYPAAMLLARASTDICRAVFPDVIAGLPSEEEVEDYDRTSSLSHPVPSIDVSSAPAAGADPPTGPPPAPGDRDPSGMVGEILAAEPGAWPEPESDEERTRRNRRLHVEIDDTFPAEDDHDRLRHALVALVTRKRRDGPAASSWALTPAETTLALARLAAIRMGRESMAFGDDGLVYYRAGQNTYSVDLRTDPPDVVHVSWAYGDPEGER